MIERSSRRVVGPACAVMFRYARQGMSISDDVTKYLNWAGNAGQAIAGALAAGKITQAVYTSLTSKLTSIGENITVLEDGGSIIEEAALVAEITGEASELVVEGAAVGVAIVAL